jgi:2-polyprenyl-3-methyl-5-hydroxy-6-metoxy-1,4-benzoquinol methylase
MPRENADIGKINEKILKYTPYKDPTSLKRLKLIIEQVLEHSERKQGSKIRVLDLGCGIGSIILPIAALGYEAIGVDIDENSIALCTEKNIFPGLTFKVGDAETLDLGQKFDVVIASEVIEHVPHPELLLRTVARHLAEDGIAVLSLPNGYSLWELIIARFIQKSRLVSKLYKSPKLYKSLTGADTPFHSRNVSCFHSHFFSFGRLKKMITRNGFQILFVRHFAMGIFPEWAVFNPFKKLECKVADFVPHALAGGWLLVVAQ